MLLPTIIVAKEAARATKCLSNQRQLLIAWHAYNDDNAGFFPVNPSEAEVYNPHNTNAADLTGGLLGPYLAAQVRVLKCPSAERQHELLRRASYGSERLRGALRAGAWRNPHLQPRLAGREAAAVAALRVQRRAPAFQDVPGAYHDGRGSFAFADGHAELHPWREPHWWWHPLRSQTNAHPFEASNGPDTRWMLAHSTYVEP